MVEGSVTLKFVIDESGKIVPGAYRLAHVSRLEFGREVLAIVPRLRYEPARIGNCRVKQLAEQKFEFKSVY
jgi:outer membrane biosynthesis protein TonB